MVLHLPGFFSSKMKRRSNSSENMEEKKKEKRYTINSENDVNTTQTRAQAWRSCPLSLHEPHHIHWISEGVNSWQNHPLLGWDREFILWLRTQFVETSLNCGVWQFLSYSTMKAWSKYLLSWIHFRSAVSWRWWDFWCVFLCVLVILRKKKGQNKILGQEKALVLILEEGPYSPFKGL